MKSLSEIGAVHQDLKPENILVKKGIGRHVAFLGDVGVAKQFTNQSSLKKLNTLTSTVGTKYWMAPEIRNPDLIQLGSGIKGDDLHIDFRKLDIFGLGLISLYCLDSPENFSKYKPILNLNSNTLHQEYLPQLKQNMPIEFYFLLKSMLSFDWNARPTIEELNQFITNYNVKIDFFFFFNI